MSHRPLTSTFARALVFLSSAAVLVLEILAGRLLAPYVGVSLETFTAIIGTMLAGIAFGAWAGGRLADDRDPAPFVGPALIVGGGLALSSLPIVAALGPAMGSSSIAIVLLAAAAFLPAAVVLSAVTPMVAKLRLTDLDQTGAVVGSLSAAGTLGALIGTFVTGFVLVALFPGRVIVWIVAVALVLTGLVTHRWLASGRPDTGLFIFLLVTAVGTVVTPTACDHETAYFCVNIEQNERATAGRDLYLDQLRHAYVNLDDPTDLDIRYVRLFAEVSEALPAGPVSSLHVGGGGFSFPRYLEAVRPGSSSVVLEIDAELVEIVQDELGLEPGPDLVVRTGDARLQLNDLANDSFDLVVGDAFGGTWVPWHLTTIEFIEEIDRVLTPDGLYVMNVLDSDDSRFARAELATLREVFGHVAVVLPPDGVSETIAVNQLLIASRQPLPELTIDPTNGIQIPSAEVDAFIDEAETLRDDFAPVDQLTQ